MEDNPYAVRRQTGRLTPWTALDDHLLYTCHVVHEVAEGRIGNCTPVPTRARLGPGEMPLAVGPAVRSSWRGLGDGTYTHGSMLAFGGPAFVVGSLVGSALGNAARRRRAAADAQPRWVTEGPGELTVTDRRACFGGGGGTFELWWSGLDAVDLVAPDIFQCSYQDRDGGGHRIARLQTLWASLMFALAAHAAFPVHPLLLSGGWLPPDFEARCAAAGRWCPPVR